MVESMELVFDKEANLRERLWFIHHYASWVKKVPNHIWSREQGRLINSLILNARNFSLTAEEYLKMKENGSKVKKKI